MNKCRLTMMFAVLLMAVTSAKALTQDGDGNYLIGSVQDWKDFAEIIDKTNTGANARMTSDVDLGDDQTHIGYTGTRRYCGVFDGDGHRLTVKYNSSAYGLAPFRYTAGATIKNLHIDGSIISTYSPESHTSGIISHSRGADVISNVWVSVDIQSGGSGWIECAAFIGCNNSGNSTISDCLFTGSMKTTSGYYNGCFFGYSDSGNVTVSNCLSTGTFDYYGGSTYVESHGGIFSNCYVKQFPSSIPAAMQVTDNNLSDGTTKDNLNGERTGDDAPWVQEGSQPMLKLFALQKDGDNYYLLSSASNWKQFATIVETTPTAKAKMTADINLGDDQTVIGSDVNGGTLYYQGTFDGQGHTLTIAYNVTSGERFTTPFSLLNGATIKNLHLDGTVNSTYAYGGSIASILKGTNTIENIWNSVTAVCTGQSWAQMGAFIGVLGDGTTTISDCLYTGNITHDGGYSGYFNGGYGPKPTVNNCLVLGTFTGEFGFNGTYSNCYCKHASTTGVTQPLNDNLSDGTTTAALNGERTGDDAPWVQYGDAPMLKIFYRKNLVAHEGDVAGEYWTTFFCSDKNYRINDAEEATAYTAIVSGEAIKLLPLNKDIPKNTAVIIKGEDDEISMNIVSDPDLDIPDNDLHGVDVQTNTDDIKTELGDGTFYVLGYTNNHFGFHKYTGTTMPASKAFLLLDGSTALSLNIEIDDETTGLNDVRSKMSDVRSDVFFDLNGRRVENPTKGIYIHNGKKIVFNH